MLFDPPAYPMPYNPDVETPLKDEAKIQQDLIDEILKISHITYEDGGHAMRGVHAKSHGIVKARLIVPGDLPAALAQGLFAKAGDYEAILRFSTSPGDILDDSISTIRAMAIKVLGVEGDRLPGSEGAQTQDFLLTIGKAFLTPDPKLFLANLKMLAATTDKAEGLKKVLATALQAAEGAIEAAGGQSGTLISLGGHPKTHILGDSFFSQVPIRFGANIAKIGVRPVSAALKALTDAPVDMHGRPNALREEVKSFFTTNGGEWELLAQLAINQHDTPIENAKVQWPEDKSPYVPVARLIVEPQDSWNEPAAEKTNDALAYSPWHGIVEHQPLGSINRVRKAVYEASEKFRLPLNGCPMSEPRSFEAIGRDV